MTAQAYLVIDTSTRHGAVGVFAGGVLVRSLSWSTRNNHTSELMPALDVVLRGAGLQPSGLAGIVVAHGPGGFSALRAGLGAAKGLSFATGLPVVGVSTLEASAYPYRGLGLPVCPLIEAGRELVAWARFAQTESGWKRRTADRVTATDILLAYTGRHLLFCGEGVGTYASRLREVMGDRAHVVEEPAPLSRLGGLAELGAARLEAGDGGSVTALRPHYLRSPGITQPRAPRLIHN